MIGSPRALPRISGLTRERWLHHLRQDGGPVLIEGGLRATPALSRWSLDYLTQRAGARTIELEYSVRPIYRPDPRVHGGLYLRAETTLAEALVLIERPKPGLHHYLSTLDVQQHLPELVPDVPVPEFVPRRTPRGIYLFAGGPNTGSHPHYDLTENLLAVFQGRKSVLLLPPGQFAALQPLPALYPTCNMSRVHPGKLSWRDWVRACGLESYECEVGPGEMLFIPLHWWHFVQNVTLTLGVSYSFDVAFRRRLRWRHQRVYMRGQLERWLSRRPRVYQRVRTWLDRTVT